MWHFSCKHEQRGSLEMFSLAVEMEKLHYGSLLFKMNLSVCGFRMLSGNGCQKWKEQKALHCNIRLNKDFRVSGWNCRSQPGQGYRLLCSDVLKQHKSVTNTALFPHGCSACQGGWKGLIHFTLSQRPALRHKAIRWKHAVHSTRGFQSQMEEPPGVCFRWELFNFTLFSQCLRSAQWENASEPGLWISG